jgi:hypothetical protein
VLIKFRMPREWDIVSDRRDNGVFCGDLRTVQECPGDELGHGERSRWQMSRKNK